MKTTKFFWIGGIILSLAVLLMSLNTPVGAAPALQLTQFLTPTPGADGRILYIVQEGDTLWRIAAITELSIDELRNLNNMTGDGIIVPGQALLLGFGGPTGQATPAPEAATAAPEAAAPTPTPGPGTADVCILLFDDINGDAIRQETELSIPNGALSLTNRSGSVSLTAETVEGTEPRCFAQVLEGDYNISVAIPDGYNPTTVLNYALPLEAGDTVYLDFGAQASSEMQAEIPPTVEEGGQSSLLGILGVVLLLVGLGLGLFAGRMRRPRLIKE